MKGPQNDSSQNSKVCVEKQIVMLYPSMPPLKLAQMKMDKLLTFSLHVQLVATKSNRTLCELSSAIMCHLSKHNPGKPFPHF